jgi:hypothetical protein
MTGIATRQGFAGERPKMVPDYLFTIRPPKPMLPRTGQKGDTEKKKKRGHSSFFLFV